MITRRDEKVMSRREGGACGRALHAEGLVLICTIVIIKTALRSRKKRNEWLAVEYINRTWNYIEWKLGCCHTSNSRKGWKSEGIRACNREETLVQSARYGKKLQLEPSGSSQTESE